MNVRQNLQVNEINLPEIQRKADNGDLECQYLIGSYYYRLSNHPAAYRYFTLASNSNHPHALYMLGQYAYKGMLDQKEDIPRAIEFYRRAKDHSKIDAIFALGLCYEKKLADYSTAIGWYQQALKHETLKAKAARHLGICYQLLNDPKSAEQYLTLAIEYKDNKAATALANLKKLSNPATPVNGQHQPIVSPLPTPSAMADIKQPAKVLPISHSHDNDEDEKKSSVTPPVHHRSASEKIPIGNQQQHRKLFSEQIDKDKLKKIDLKSLFDDLRKHFISNKLLEMKSCYQEDTIKYLGTLISQECEDLPGFYARNYEDESIKLFFKSLPIAYLVVKDSDFHFVFMLLVEKNLLIIGINGEQEKDLLYQFIRKIDLSKYNLDGIYFSSNCFRKHDSQLIDYSGPICMEMVSHLTKQYADAKRTNTIDYFLKEITKFINVADKAVRFKILKDSRLNNIMVKGMSDKLGKTGFNMQPIIARQTIDFFLKENIEQLNLIPGFSYKGKNAFFDSFVQAYNQIINNNKSFQDDTITIAKARKLCKEFFTIRANVKLSDWRQHEENFAKQIKWVKDLYATDAEFKKYIESIENYDEDKALLADFRKEGRILCSKLSLVKLHYILIPEEKDVAPKHFLITSMGIEEKSAVELYSHWQEKVKQYGDSHYADDRVIHLIEYKNHVVPLLYKGFFPYSAIKITGLTQVLSPKLSGDECNITEKVVAERRLMLNVAAIKRSHFDSFNNEVKKPNNSFVLTERQKESVSKIIALLTKVDDESSIGEKIQNKLDRFPNQLINQWRSEAAHTKNPLTRPLLLQLIASPRNLHQILTRKKKKDDEEIDVNIEDVDGNTALHAAVSAAGPNVKLGLDSNAGKSFLILLEQKSINHAAVNHKGETILYLCLHYNLLLFINKFLDKFPQAVSLLDGDVQQGILSAATLECKKSIEMEYQKSRLQLQEKFDQNTIECFKSAANNLSPWIKAMSIVKNLPDIYTEFLLINLAEEIVWNARIIEDRLHRENELNSYSVSELGISENRLAMLELEQIQKEIETRKGNIKKLDMHDGSSFRPTVYKDFRFIGKTYDTVLMSVADKSFLDAKKMLDVSKQHKNMPILILIRAKLANEKYENTYYVYGYQYTQEWGFTEPDNHKLDIELTHLVFPDVGQPAKLYNWGGKHNGLCQYLTELGAHYHDNYEFKSPENRKVYLRAMYVTRNIDTPQKLVPRSPRSPNLRPLSPSPLSPRLSSRDSKAFNFFRASSRPLSPLPLDILEDKPLPVEYQELKTMYDQLLKLRGDREQELDTIKKKHIEWSTDFKKVEDQKIAAEEKQIAHQKKLSDLKHEIEKITPIIKPEAIEEFTRTHPVPPKKDEKNPEKALVDIKRYQNEMAEYSKAKAEYDERERIYYEKSTKYLEVLSAQSKQRQLKVEEEEIKAEYDRIQVEYKKLQDVGVAHSVAKDVHIRAKSEFLREWRLRLAEAKSRLKIIYDRSYDEIKKLESFSKQRIVEMRKNRDMIKNRLKQHLDSEEDDSAPQAMQQWLQEKINMQQEEQSQRQILNNWELWRNPIMQILKRNDESDDAPPQVNVASAEIKSPSNASAPAGNAAFFNANVNAAAAAQPQPPNGAADSKYSAPTSPMAAALPKPTGKS